MSSDRRVMNLLEEPPPPGNTSLEGKLPSGDVGNMPGVDALFQDSIVRIQTEPSCQILQPRCLTPANPGGVLTFLIILQQVVDSYVTLILAHLRGLEAVTEANHLREGNRSQGNL